MSEQRGQDHRRESSGIISLIYRPHLRTAKGQLWAVLKLEDEGSSQPTEEHSRGKGCPCQELTEYKSSGRMKMENIRTDGGKGERKN